MNRRHSSRCKEEALFEAVETGNYHKVYDLLSNGANKDALNKEGRTALYIATEKGNVDLVRLLVNAGADPLIRDKDGEVAVECLKRTAMSEAVMRRIYECLTNRKLENQAVDQPFPDPNFSFDALSAEQVVEKFTSTMSQVATPFLRALCGHPEAPRTVRVAPVPAMIANLRPVVPVFAPDVSTPAAAATNTTPIVSPDTSTPANSQLLPVDTVPTSTSPGLSTTNAATSVPLHNWLTPVLRLKGMSDQNIIQQVCNLVIGELEYTEEGFAIMSDDKFEKTFAHHFTVPGRLATLQCALRHIRRTYKEFEDGMSELRVHTNTAEAAGSSTESLQSQREQQAPTAPFVTSSQHDTAASHGPVVVNTACSSSETAAVSAAAGGIVHVPGASSADSVSAAQRPHVCALNCVCVTATARVGRKHGRAITPVRVTAGPWTPSPLVNSCSPPTSKRRSYSPSPRAVLLPEPGEYFAGSVLAHLREKRANHATHKHP